MRREVSGILNQILNTRAMTPPRLQIGKWRANRATNELGHAGDAARIEPKVIEILRVLVDRPCEVVSRDDTLAAVWPGVFVGDAPAGQNPRCRALEGGEALHR